MSEPLPCRHACGEDAAQRSSDAHACKGDSARNQNPGGKAQCARRDFQKLLARPRTRGRKANAFVTLQQCVQDLVNTAAASQMRSRLQAEMPWGQCRAWRGHGAARRLSHADCCRQSGWRACSLLRRLRAAAVTPALDRPRSPRAVPRHAPPPLGSGRPRPRAPLPPRRGRQPWAVGMLASFWPGAAVARSSDPCPSGARSGARATRVRARRRARRPAAPAWPALGTPWQCPGSRRHPSRPFPALRKRSAAAFSRASSLAEADGRPVLRHWRGTARERSRALQLGTERAALSSPRPCRATKVSIHSRSSRFMRAAAPGSVPCAIFLPLAKIGGNLESRTAVFQKTPNGS
jgi:hypothetical protein